MARTDPRPHYRTGRRLRTDGYVDIWAPGHPIARKDGYVFEHRMLAWDSGLLIDPSDEVHHRNEVKDDNRLDNFEILSTSAHARHHGAALSVVRNQYGEWPRDAPPEHGTVRQYRRGCRCRPCVDEGVALANFYKRRRRAAS